MQGLMARETSFLTDDCVTQVAGLNPECIAQAHSFQRVAQSCSDSPLRVIR